MVKLFALSVFYKGSNEARLLKSAYDLQSFSFFQRSSVQEFIGYVEKTVFSFKKSHWTKITLIDLIWFSLLCFISHVDSRAEQ